MFFEKLEKIISISNLLMCLDTKQLWVSAFRTQEVLFHLKISCEKSLL